MRNVRDKLLEETLAYFLADESEKENLKQLFHMVKEDIETKVEDANTRKIYGRTLLSLSDCLQTEEWMANNIQELDEIKNENDLLKYIWPLLKELIRNRPFIKCNPPDILIDAAIDWINGVSYVEIFQKHLNGARLGTGKRPRRLKIEHTVDLCENGYGYDGSLIIGALAEIADQYENEEGDFSQLVKRLLTLQKKIKYGLPTLTDTVIFELGFSDRVVAQKVNHFINTTSHFESKVRSLIRKNRQQLKKELADYPSYYIKVFDKIIA